MKKLNFKATGAVLTLAAMAALGGCGGGQNTADNGAAGEGATTGGNATNTASTAEVAFPKTVTVGYNPTIAQPQLLIGDVEKAYEKAMPGVKFVFKTYPAGPAVVEALRAGVVDIGSSGIYPPMKAYAKDGDILMLAGAATGGTELVVAKNGPVKTLADLKGKVIGVNQLGSTVDTMVRNALLEAKINPETDVKIIPIPPAQQADSLKRGEVSAVAAPAPWPSNAIVNGGGRALLNYKDILDNGNYLAGSIYATKKFSTANAAFITKFVEANTTLTDELNKDRAKADARVLAAWEKVSDKKLPAAVAKAAFGTMKYTTQASTEDLQRFADIALKTGSLKKKADLSGFVFTGK
jgi:sulfonate transport system substrate-binding protein